MVLILNDPTAHAEIIAIRNASKILNNFKLTNCVLYTSCYPCSMCMSAALWAGLEKIYFAATTKDVIIIFIIFKMLN